MQRDNPDSSENVKVHSFPIYVSVQYSLIVCFDETFDQAAVRCSSGLKSREERCLFLEKTRTIPLLAAGGFIFCGENR